MHLRSEICVKVGLVDRVVGLPVWACFGFEAVAGAAVDWELGLFVLRSVCRVCVDSCVL
jgi:hypothetical protein